MQQASVVFPTDGAKKKVLNYTHGVKVSQFVSKQRQMSWKETFLFFFLVINSKCDILSAPAVRAEVIFRLQLLLRKNSAVVLTGLAA